MTDRDRLVLVDPARVGPFKPDLADMSATDKKNRRRTKRPAPVRMPWWVYYPMFLTVAGVAYWLFRGGDPVAAIGFVAVFFCGVTGFRIGLANIVASLLGIYAAFAIAPPLGLAAEVRFAEYVGTGGLLNRLLCIGVFGVLISMIVTMVLMMLSDWFFTRRRRLDLMNCQAGFVFGLAEGAILVLLVLGASLTFSGINNANAVGRMIDSIAAGTRTSVVGPFVIKNNPFERFEMLAKLEEIPRSIEFIQDSENIESLLEDPDVIALRDDPELQQAIEEVRRDPVIKQLLSGKRQMDRDTMMELMNSPAILELVENESFRQCAAKIIHRDSKPQLLGGAPVPMQFDE